MGLNFEFNEEQFNALFPFFILISKDKQVLSVGKSLNKIYPIHIPVDFLKKFTFKRPQISDLKSDEFQNILNELVIIECRDNKEIILRGQINYLPNSSNYLFVGTPWFDEIDQVSKFKLSINDFARHDPLIELHHVLKNQEITNEEIKLLLLKVNEQKDKLKISENKFRNIVEQASDIIYKYSLDGHFCYVNEVAERLTGYKKEELYKMTYLDLVRPDYRSLVETFYIDQIENNKTTSYFEFPILSKSGKEIWIGQSVQFPKDKTQDTELTALAINISERKLAELNLSLQEEKYRNIIANMNLGMLEVDNDDLIQSANQSFSEMSGYSIKELIGKKAAEILLDPNTKNLVNEKNKIRSEGVSDMYSVQVKNKNGENRWWMISGAPRYNDKGDLVGSVGIHLDITEQKLLEEELRIAKIKAEDSSVAKESFLATMSHEIRTPLNAILGITNMMKINSESRTTENIEILSFSTKNLLSLITDILDFSKIEAGRIELSNSIVELSNLLEGTYQTFRTICEEKGVSLSLNVGENLPSHIYGDELRLSQILNNLLSNAVKFTLDGKIEITVQSDWKNRSEATLTFSIKDTGIGIPEDKLDSIFKAFEQADNSISNRFGGTGLGLNITKKLIELQGGWIKVKSKHKYGSEFIFSITYKIPEQIEINSKISDKYVEGKSGSLKGTVVLLVEDNIINQKVALSYLNHWELKCDIANNGEEAIHLLKEKNYDVVLMDLYMPIMNGFDTITFIRNEMNLTSLPIIALTASAEKSIMDKVISLGANLCISKPFNPKQLYEGIAGLIVSESRQIIDKIEPEPISITTDTEFKTINLKLLKDTSFNSNAFVLEMLGMICRDVPKSITSAKTLFEEGKYDVFSTTIHKLKSSLLILGLEHVHQDLNFMEENSRKSENLKEVEERFKQLEKTWILALKEIEVAIKLYS